MDYKEAGVDVNKGNNASSILYEAAKKSFMNRKDKFGEVVVPTDDFSGLRGIDLGGLPKGTIASLGFDGIGTKVSIAQRIGVHDTMAYDLLAMVCDDAIVRGGEPILVGTVLDVDKLTDDTNNINAIKQIAKGYSDAAEEAGVTIINGELAELGNLVSGEGKFNYNWSACVLWVADKDKIITGKDISPDDSVVMIREGGFRSNGLTLARKILAKKFGNYWHNNNFKENLSYGKAMLHPSTIYSKHFIELYGSLKQSPNAEIHGVCHITGGGIPEKLGRVLKVTKNLGANLDNLFEPCELMLKCQELGDVTDKEAYSTWNMGQGLAIITPEPDKVISHFTSKGIDAQIAGKITSEKGIRLISKGAESKGEELSFGL